MNDRGDVVWSGYQSSWGAGHAFLNRTDLTMKYLGRNVESGVRKVNEGGTVLWAYVEDTGTPRLHVMRDGLDLSVSVLGTPDPYGGGITLNNRGDVLWASGLSAGGGNLHLFVNDYDLVTDLLGSGTYDSVTGMDLNGSGQVLWSLARNNQTYYYLSTPVPEPSVLLLALPMLALVVKRRKR